MSCITLGTITNNIWYILLMSFFDNLSFWTNHSLQNFYPNEYCQLMFSFSTSVSLLFAIIPEIISYYQKRTIRRRQETVKYNTNRISMIQSTKDMVYYSNSISWKKCLYFIIAIILYVLQVYLKEIVYNPPIKGDSYIEDMNSVFSSYCQISVFALFATSIMSHFVFRFKVFRHHLLGFGIILICSLLSLLVSHVETENIWITLAYLFTIVILQSLLTVFQKVLMQFEGVSPHLILFFQGLFSLLYSIIKIAYSSEEKWINLTYLLFTGEWTALLFMYSNIICYYFFFTFTILTNQFYSPNHLYLSPGMAGLYCWSFHIISLIFGEEEDLPCTLFFTVSYPIWCLGCLLYNELIILNFWRFQDNVRKNIIERADSDKDMIQIENEELEKEQLDS